MEMVVSDLQRTGGVRQIACNALAALCRKLAWPPLSVSRWFERAADWFEERGQ